MLSVSTQITRGDSLAEFERMLRSVAFADEINIFDMERKDKEFIELAKKYHARIIEVKTPPVVEVIRAEQLRVAKYDWILIMDGDEVITPTLRNEIIDIISKADKLTSSKAVYALRRRNYSFGSALTRGGWGDDYVPRLFHRSLFIDWPTDIHSLPIVKGNIQKTKHYLEHHKDASLSQMVDKTNRYSAVEAAEFYAGHLPPVTPLTLIRKWWMESFRRGILKLGILDGKIGLIQSLYQGFSVFISYAKLYEKQISKKGKQ